VVASDGVVNISAIPCILRLHVRNNVDTLWIAGSMGQWPQLSANERVLLFEEYLKADRRMRETGEVTGEGIKFICHVGSNSVAEGEDMARRAADLGCPTLAVIPAAYPSPPSSIEAIVENVRRIWIAGKKLPMFYYHIPAVTRVSLPIVDIVDALADAGIALAGIKFVEDSLDAFATLQEKYPSMLAYWAPDPKAAAVPFGADKFVLAEVYKGPFVRQMLEATIAGNFSGARHWSSLYDELAAAEKVASSRDVQALLNCDVGPPLLPSLPTSAEEKEAQARALNDMKFFDYVAKA
jgi:N-acetylneuraminate lyase